MSRRPHPSLITLAALCPLLLGGTAALWLSTAHAPVILPSQPPAELTEIPALRPPPIVVHTADTGWQENQRRHPPSLELDLAVRLDLPRAAQTADPDAAQPPAPPRPGLLEASIPVASFLVSEQAPGTLTKTTWTAGEALHGESIATPVLVATGAKPGHTLCVTAAVHGDELNGIEAVRRLLHTINPGRLHGRVIGVPIVNLHGFHRQSRYLADRRDLNRFFPGNPRGSAASRMAHGFFNDVIKHCDALVDLHTGSFHRTNLPQLRADLNNPDVLALTQGFGSTVVLHSAGGTGTLRRAASDAGIPAVTFEAGEPLRLQTEAVDHAVKALFTLLDTLQLYNKRSLWGASEPTYYSSTWVRADHGGILLTKARLGRRVKTGDLLGSVIDPITNERVAIDAPYAGRIIGMALSQFVMPGFAAFHLAREAEPGQISEDEHDASSGLEVAVMEHLGADESE